MKSMRRLGLVLMVLFLGIIIGNFGMRTALLIFVPFYGLCCGMKRNTVSLNGVGFMMTLFIQTPIIDRDTLDLDP